MNHQIAALLPIAFFDARSLLLVRSPIVEFEERTVDVAQRIQDVLLKLRREPQYLQFGFVRRLGWFIGLGGAGTAK